MGGLHERFVALCETPSPTGSEGEVAQLVRSELEQLGLSVEEDDAAGPARAGAGNLLCRVPGRGGAWVMLAAHLDTVPHGEPVRVMRDGGIYRSAGPTILGADNKAAVAVLVELAGELAAAPAEAGVELVLTVAEEDGLRGAHAFDVQRLRSPWGFVFDHASPIGEIVVAAPTYHRLRAEFRGQAAHAGIRPEAGANAIVAAARAVAEMPQGRLDEQTTANVGRLTGGSATNVVAPHCRLEAETRSLSEARAGEVLEAMVEACSWAAGGTDVDVDVDVQTLFRGYRLEPNEPPVAAAAAALRRCGHEVDHRATGGGSDANAFVPRGFCCVNLANGTTANHTAEEAVAADRLDEMLAVARELVAEAARRC